MKNKRKKETDRTTYIIIIIILCKPPPIVANIKTTICYPSLCRISISPTHTVFDAFLMCLLSDSTCLTFTYTPRVYFGCHYHSIAKAYSSIQHG